MAYLNVKISDRLKNAVGDAAERADVTMNEWVACTLAEKLERPELAAMKRKRPGRPRVVLKLKEKK